MGNKALKTLRKFFGETPFFAGKGGELEGGEIVALIEDAIAHATAKPEHQFAVEQARLMKAKADLAEWQAYKETEGLRVPSFVEPDISGQPVVQAPSEPKPLEVFIGGLRFFVNKPTEAVCDELGNTTMTASIGVDVQVDEPVRRIFMDEFDANWGEPVASPSIASIPETVVQGEDAAILASEAFCTVASEFAGLQREVQKLATEAGHNVARAAGKALAALGQENTKDQAARIREAEEWGFLRGKRVALEAVERRWRSVRAYSSPSYDDAMCAAVEEIKGIALPKVEA